MLKSRSLRKKSIDNQLIKRQKEVFFRGFKLKKKASFEHF